MFVARRMDFDGELEKVGQALLHPTHSATNRMEVSSSKLTNHRVICLIYMYDVLLHTKWEGPSSGECSDFFTMPLPCTRELWQTSTDEEWSRLYYAEHNTNITEERMNLTFEHLLSVRRASLHGEYVTSDLTNAVAKWCEKADDLSMLLWIALTIEGEGQVPGLSKIPDIPVL